MIVLQKAVTPALVHAYLAGGYDRVSGYVVRAAEVSDITSPADLRRLHLTDYPQTTFPNGGPIHILHVDRSPAWNLIPADKIHERPVLNSSGTVEVDEQLIPVFYLDHSRLTAGARLWRFEENQEPVLVATYNGPTLGWQNPESGALVHMAPTPIVGDVLVVGSTAFSAQVSCNESGAPVTIVAVSPQEPSDVPDFQQNLAGLWVRQFEHPELRALFESQLVSTFRDLPVQVVARLTRPDGTKLARITSLARDYEAPERLGFTEVELGVWEATVPLAELTTPTPREISPQSWMTAEQRTRLAAAQQNPTAGAAATPSGPTVTITSPPGTGIYDSAHLKLYQQILSAVVPNAPTDATQIQLMCEVVGDRMNVAAQALKPEDGSVSGLPPVGPEVAKAFAQLRTLEAKPGIGTWFTAFVLIEKTGNLKVKFDAQRKPSLKLTQQMIDVEKQHFPRESYPEWFTPEEE